MLDDPERVRQVQQRVDRKVHVRSTDARRVERKAAGLERMLQRIVVVERPIQYRLAVPRGTDDVVRRAPAGIHPVALGVEHVELVGLVRAHLPADQHLDVELQPALLQEGLVLAGHPPHLLAEEVDGLVEPAERLLSGREGLLEVRQGLVPNGPQARRHDEHRAAVPLVSRDLLGGQALVPGRDAGIGDTHQPFLNVDSQAKSHTFANPAVPPECLCCRGEKKVSCKASPTLFSLTWVSSRNSCRPATITSPIAV